MKTFILAVLILFIYSGITTEAKVIENNVTTGEVIERDYTQKELDAIAVETVAAGIRKIVSEKKEDIAAKREAAIEALLMSGTSTEARAYQDAIK